MSNQPIIHDIRGDILETHQIDRATARTRRVLEPLNKQSTAANGYEDDGADTPVIIAVYRVTPLCEEHGDIGVPYTFDSREIGADDPYEYMPPRRFGQDAARCCNAQLGDSKLQDNMFPYPRKPERLSK